MVFSEYAQQECSREDRESNWWPDDFEPACSGTETPFTMGGLTYTYMWSRSCKIHAYYCHQQDVFISTDEFEERK